MNDFHNFHLGLDANIITADLPGPKSRRMLDFQRSNEGNIVSYPTKMPIAIKRSRGAIIEDVDGNTFIDFFGGAGVLNVGQCNPYVMNYVKRQQEELIHALDFPTQNKIDLIKKILNGLPEDIRDQYKVSFCGPTGSDAVEASIKLAKIKTGREGVIAFHGSYHGMTSGSLAVTSDVSFRNKIKALVPNISFIPYSYCYRCPFGKKSSTCALECADYLEYILSNPHSGQTKPAAILLEPIQGEGGTIIPKKGYLERIVKIAKDYGIVVIFDEIQCGFFRTGKFLSFQDGTAVPDIITMSKGLGGIGFPISAIIYKRDIEAWGPGDHIGTFRGNQVSIAAGNGAFDFVKEYDLENHASKMGRYLMSKLETLKDSFSVIGDIRNSGLMFGVEYVEDRGSKVPNINIVKKIREICFANGLLFETGGHYHNVIRFLPSLTINKTIIDNAFEIFKKAHEEAVNKVGEHAAIELKKESIKTAS